MVPVPPLDPHFVELLACPVPDCHSPLRQADGRLLCERCRLAYRIENFGPVLIPEEAEPIETPAE